MTHRSNSQFSSGSSESNSDSSSNKAKQRPWRLSWKEISEFHAGEWVELVDVEWKASLTHPWRAKVKNHSFSRTELLKETSKDSTILYVDPIALVSKLVIQHASESAVF